MRTVSVLEIVWTALAAVGCYFSSKGVVDAYADLKLLRAQSRNGDALVIGKQVLRNEWIRLGMLGAFVLIGAIAMTLRSVGSDYSPSRILLAALFIVAEAVLVYASFADRRDAKHLLSKPREET